MRSKETLKQLQALPLDMKIKITKQRIRECVRANGISGVYISFSGGKDSTVLLHISREIYPEIKAVFIDTGLEFPEIRQFAGSFTDVKFIYPKKRFDQVISTYGYPLIGKMASHNIGILRRKPDGNIAKNVFSPEKRGPYAMAKWSPIAEMDFCVSEKCCYYSKKEPANRYSKQTGRIPITAQMACESQLRTSQWIAHGCNAFDCERPISNPMSIWTEQDVLLYIKSHSKEMIRWRIENIEELYSSPLESIIDAETGEPKFPRDKITPIFSVYGEIVYDCQDPDQERFTEATNLRLKTTGCSRTGCIYCAYGCHLEKGETRFQRLARTHPKQYTYCIGGGEYDPSDGLWKPNKKGLGLGHVFDELNKVYGENFLRYKPLETTNNDDERKESNE